MNVLQDLYPSRISNEEKIFDRREPVLFGTKEDGILSAEQLGFYEKNGFVVLPGILEDKAKALIEDMERMKKSLKGREEIILEPRSEVVRSIFAPEKHSDVAREISRDPYLLGAAQQLLGGQVYIHHSRINVKSSFNGKSFPWHSDFETWHVEDGIPHMRILTGWVFLTENNAFNGSLFAIPESQNRYVSCAGKTPEDNYKSSLRKQEYGVPSREAIETLVEHGGMEGIYGPPGTVVFHEGNLMHGSTDNMSPYSRTNMFFVYNSVENTPVEPFGGTEPRPSFLASRDFTPLQ